MDADAPAPPPLVPADVVKQPATQDAEAAERLQRLIINSTKVPEQVIDDLIEVWIRARRLDEGVKRPVKPDQLARQVALTRVNRPLMDLIRAAYRAGVYDTLYSPTEEEGQP